MLDEKIDAILLSDVALHICKMQLHWSIQMEWPGSNQSALTTHHTLYLSLYFLDSIARRNRGRRFFAYHGFQ